jgi:hypothetical protein
MMTKEQIIVRLQELANNAKDGDEEDAHREADIILCELLSTLGYKEVVDAYGEIEKWYA